MITAITNAIRDMLDHQFGVPAQRAQLGTRIQNIENAIIGMDFDGMNHNYAGAHADWTMSATEANYSLITVSNSDADVNMIAPATAYETYFVRNNTSYDLTVKVTGQTGVVIPSGKGAIVTCNGTDYVFLADSFVRDTALAVNYSGAHADYTVTDAQKTAFLYNCTNADAAANLIVPAEVKLFEVYNNIGYVLTVKVTGQTGIQVPNGSRVLCICNGTDVFKVDDELSTSATINFGGAHADHTLAGVNLDADVLIASNADAAANILAPDVAGRKYTVINSAGFDVVIKKSGGTGTLVPNGQSMTVFHNGTDYVPANPVENIFGVIPSIDLSGGDYTLSSVQCRSTFLEVTVGHAANAIITPVTKGLLYVVVNNDTTNNALIKDAGGTAVTIPPSTKGIVYHNGTDLIEIYERRLSNAEINGLTLGVSITLDISGGDVTLNATQINTTFLEVSTGHATNALILPTNVGARPYIIKNNDTTNPVLAKKAAGTAVVIPPGKTGIVYYGASSQYELLQVVDNTFTLTTAVTLAGGDVTLTAAQCMNRVIEVTTGHATNAIIAPVTPGLWFIVKNNDTANIVNIKDVGGAAAVLPPYSSALVYHNGTDFVVSVDNCLYKNFSIVTSINLGGGDMTLSTAQYDTEVFEVTTGHATNAIIGPAGSGRHYTVVNNDTVNNVLFKDTGGTPVTIPPLSVGRVYHNGTDYVLMSLYDGRAKQASHDYGGAAVDWTLNAAEAGAQTLIVTNANAGCAIVAPDVAGTRYLIKNTSGQACTIKKSGGAGVAVTNAKIVFVEHLGGDYAAITAEL